jgi:hypothetical protein
MGAPNSMITRLIFSIVSLSIFVKSTFGTVFRLKQKKREEEFLM